jgi:pilus assembly protein CpaF
MDRALKNKIKQKLVSDHKSLFSHDSVKEKELREVINKIINDFVFFDHLTISDADRKALIHELMNELVGLGALEELLNDFSITEIMINGPKRVYLERNGKKELSGVTFDDDEQLMYIIHKILAPTRRRVDESFPYTDLALKDGSRVNIVIPPLSLDGPTITIRKFSKEIKKIEDLIRLDSIDERLSKFLIASIKAKMNIIFSGATGVGKTTTLSVLSSSIGNDERIITIEDTAEISLEQEHVVRLEARQSNIEGKGEISIRDLFKNSLRMRPERIIIGEIRGAEALDMLQAICSGHRGSLAIIHASSPQDVIYRLETMILTSGVPISLEMIHRQINASINLIVHQEQLLDGSRKITRVTQINGLKGNEVVLEDIFVFYPEGEETAQKVKGRWKATGVVPVFYPLFKKSGIDLPQELFHKD